MMDGRVFVVDRGEVDDARTVNLPIASLLVAMALPYVWGAASVPLRKKQFGSLDNNHPREQQAKATGALARAQGASANAFEALAVYGPAVVLQQVAAPTAALASTLALAWIVARVLHGVCYLANLAPVRSLMWLVGMACAVSHVLLALRVL
jgi:uncharacterized MAPEG superfamily protein